ncbi:MAG: hypothetical protein M1517_08710 [Deltaproteobacteria bacterium]|nr:hypothetical protein [Deltaproteobacteria bacterium]
MVLRNNVLVVLIMGLLLCVIQPLEAKVGETSNSGYESFTELVSEFKNLTEVQQERWNIRNKLKHWVNGEGTVSEVEEADVFSEIQGNYYEVTVELEDGNRAVIFYPRTRKYNWVGDLQKDSQLSFKGRLKSIKDWGMWVSGYIKGE